MKDEDIDIGNLTGYLYLGTATGICLGLCAGIAIKESEFKKSALAKDAIISRQILIDGAKKDIHIPFSAYFEHKKRQRSSDAISGFQTNWNNSLPLNFELEDLILNRLNVSSLSSEQTAQKIISFVNQNIVYIEDIEGYLKSPIETIVEGSGDCEDSSLLAYTLLKRAGINTKLALCKPLPQSTNSGHVAVVISGNFGNGWNCNYQGTNWYFAETTGLLDSESTQKIYRKIGDSRDSTWTNYSISLLDTNIPKK